MEVSVTEQNDYLNNGIFMVRVPRVGTIIVVGYVVNSFLDISIQNEVSMLVY